MDKNYTYILLCADGSLYTGWTNDMARRLAAHNAGTASKFTRARRPVSLFYCEQYETKQQAMSREWHLKRLTRPQKLALRGSEADISDSVLKEVNGLQNIILIGMPGSGKSTVGVLLAKALLMDFIDTDLLIQKRCGAALCDVIAADGVERFKAIENEVLSQVDCRNTVIATGGSAVYGEGAMQHLRKGGVTVYLKLPIDEIKRRIDNISTRGIAMEQGATLDSLYGERAALYERYADLTADCSGLTAEGCVEKIISLIK